MDSYAELCDAYSRHVNPSFVKLLNVFGYGRRVTGARGVTVVDEQGKSYVDAIAGFGSINLGHNPPRLVAALHAALDAAPYRFLHFAPCETAAACAQALTRRMGAPFERVTFVNTGSDAVEAAMKLAVLATGRDRFVHAAGGYHGLGFGALSLMGHERMRKPFKGLITPQTAVPWNDLEALRRALAKKTVAAVVLEPLQAEGGVRLPAPGYLDAALRLCRETGTLLVLDEIQTGLGRLGSWFAYEQMREPPDVVVLAKALSGGMVPIGAMVTTRALHDKAFGKMDRFDLCSSTFAGHPLACRAALETLAIIEDDGLVARSREQGARLLARLRAATAGHPLVADVRGEGLLIGIEIGATGQGVLGRVAPGLVNKMSQVALGQWLAFRLLEAGCLVQTAAHRWDVLKIEPPLVLDDADADRIVEAVKSVLTDHQSVPRMVTAMTRQMHRQRKHADAHAPA